MIKNFPSSQKQKQKQTQRINIELNDLEDITCPHCENTMFKTGIVRLKKLPAVQSPSGREQAVTINHVQCTICADFFILKDCTLFHTSKKEKEKICS